MIYSQSGVIEKYLLTYFPSPPGFFLEIGCWDGEHYSQTAYAERELAWRGLCVDPFPRGFENRACLLCNRAISADGSIRDFVLVSTDRRDGGDVSYLSGFRDSLRYHWDLIQEFCNYEIVQVETITMEQLYKDYHLPDYIEFLSLDTEGSEWEILSSMDLNHKRFGMIAFEHNMDEAVRRAMGNLLDKHDYRFLTNMGWDDIYLWRGLG